MSNALSALNGSVRVDANFSLAEAFYDLASKKDDINYKRTNQYANAESGTGYGLVSDSWRDIRQLASGANEALDLSGSLSNAFGDVLLFSSIKLIIIENRGKPGGTATDKGLNSLIVGGAAANAWVSPFGAANDTITIRPGGRLVLEAPDATGYVVTAGTADQLKIAAGATDGNAVDYAIVLVGMA